MKNFLKHTLEWKINTCLFFTASVLIVMAILFFTGSKTIDIAIIFSLLLMSMCGTILQGIAFTDLLFHRLRYSLRLLLFAGLYAPILILLATIFKWFPQGNLISWLVFIGIFALISIGMTVGFEIYYRVQGKKYDGLLGQYRKQKESEK